MIVTPLHLQLQLQNALVLAEPLKESDLDDLFNVAADPLIWEQHPNKNRYQRAEFEIYFKGAIESQGAFLVKDRQSHEIIGSSRYYDYKPGEDTISIGYTFFKRNFWGKGHNYALKKLMLDHIFQYVGTVAFDIGATNKRSQISIEKLGALKTGEEQIAYYGEASKLNYRYIISKSQWATLRKALPG